MNTVVKTDSSSPTIAFLGNYLPRKCGIATFTSDVLGAVAARHPQSRCFAVAVNDIEPPVFIFFPFFVLAIWRTVHLTVTDESARMRPTQH